MLHLIEHLPVELVCTNVLGYLSLHDIVMLERASCSKKSHDFFLSIVPHCPPVVLPLYIQSNMVLLNWFAKVQYKIVLLNIQQGDNPCLHVENLRVDHFKLNISATITMEALNYLIDKNIGHKIEAIIIREMQNREVMEQLSACTSHITQLEIEHSVNCMDWLTIDVLSKWKLKGLFTYASTITTSLIALIIQTRTELTIIRLYSDNIDDSAVTTITQHFPKLATLILSSRNITWVSLLALSERGLPLKMLEIHNFLNIPTADIARRCSHALSCIHYISTSDLHRNNQDASILMPYMTGLTRLDLCCCRYISLLTQHFHKLTEISIYYEDCPVADILSLCCTNPLLQELHCYCGITDAVLIELIHACPHLHTLDLPYETDITDISILALSEHCPELQCLEIYACIQVTETAVLQLLQCCRKLTRLEVSSSSLSEETWTQLDKNTQKRVSRSKLN